MKNINYNRMRVMGNGEIYRLKTIFKMVKKFEKMNFIEQQSFLTALNSRIKKPPNECWTKKLSVREFKNKAFR